MARDRSTPCVRKRTGWIAIAIVGVPLAQNAGHGLVTLIEGRSGVAPAGTPLEFISWASWLWVSAIVVIALAALERRAIGGRLLEMRASLGPVLVAMLALCALWYAWKLIVWLMPDAGGVFWRIGSTGAFPAVVVLAVSAGVSEELVFRGFLLTRLRELTGNATLALLTTSVAFGLLHTYQSVPSALHATLFGLVLGLVTLGSQNLFPAILAHAAWDLVCAVTSAFHVVQGYA
jgi:membrane protease YdiL (CAAX protease family)